MKISIEKLKELSSSLYFSMTDGEYENLQKEFDVIISQMDLIGEIKDINNLEPMVFPYIEPTIGLREDEPTEPLKVEEVLKNAPNTMDNNIRVKKVVG